jgi:methionyl-tRNA formyltransferase
MDSGDILAQEAFPLGGRETTGSLSALAAEKAAPLLIKTLRALAGGTLHGRPQNHGEASYCALLSRDEGRIDWNQSALEIDARIRAFDPWPLSWTRQGDRLLYILEALPAGGESGGAGGGEPGRVLGVDKQRGILVQTGSGVLIVSRLQYQAKKALDWRAFLNGARDFTGSRLT